MTSLTPLQLIPIPYAIVAIRTRIQPLSSEKEAKISSFFVHLLEHGTFQLIFLVGCKSLIESCH